MSTILMLNDIRHEPNWGSQACTDALERILLDRVPGARIETLTHAWLFRQFRVSRPALGARTYLVRPRHTRLTRRLDALLQRFSSPLNYVPRVSDEYEYRADQWLAGRGGPNADEYLAKLKTCDAVVFNAEGSTYRNNHAANLCLFMLWLAKTRFQIPSFFLNGIVHLTLVDAVLPGMVRKAFEVLDGIVVREPLSLRNVQEQVPGAKAQMAPDSVFYFPRPTAPRASLQQLTAALGGRDYFCLSSSMLPVDYLGHPDSSAVVALIRALKEVVPQCVCTAKDVGDRWLQDAAARTGSLYFGPEHDYWDLSSLFEGAKFLVSGRYHNLIMATIVGCPSIALTSTSPKIQGLCELLEGQIGSAYDSTSLRAGLPAIVAQARSYVTAGDAKRRALRDLADALRPRTAELGDVVARVLASRVAGSPRPASTAA
jgi:Polysaccharide pyruvyl transferase